MPFNSFLWHVSFAIDEAGRSEKGESAHAPEHHHSHDPRRLQLRHFLPPLVALRERLALESKAFLFGDFSIILPTLGLD